LELFRALSRLGGELVTLHLLESPKLDKPLAAYKGPPNPEVGRVAWAAGAVWLDAPAPKKSRAQCRPHTPCAESGTPPGPLASSAEFGTRRVPATIPGTIGFCGVPEPVWNFHIGGYQVCEKWLKDRKGRRLSAEDIRHYEKIVVALSETIRIMGEIDRVIDEHGGWPGAFVTDPHAETNSARPQAGALPNGEGDDIPLCTAPSPEASDEADQDCGGRVWEMTRWEFHKFRVSQGFANPTENSRLYWQEIKKALADGKPLPPPVLREYEQLFGPF
jgi:hypothetical protein